MHQAIRAGNAEIAKAISPIDICSHRRCALTETQVAFSAVQTSAVKLGGGISHHAPKSGQSPVIGPRSGSGAEPQP